MFFGELDVYDLVLLRSFVDGNDSFHLFADCVVSSRIVFFEGNYTGKMRTPSLFAQCLPGLVPQDGVSTVSERDAVLPTPAVEILPSKVCFVRRLIVMHHICLA